MNDKKTLLESDPKYYGLLKSMYDEAYKLVGSEGFTPVAPPPSNKAPYFLIDSWGLEMFRIGFEMGFNMAETES